MPIVENIFVLIGIFAFGAFFITLFTSLGKNAHNLFSKEPIPSPDSRKFLATLTATCATSYSSVPMSDITDVVTDGFKFKKKLLEDIHNAKSNINISSYIWTSDASTQEITRALISAVKRGVSVRIMIDWMGAFGTWRSQIKKLRKNGIDMRFFRPLVPGKLLNFYARNHRRAIIIDGEYAYIGGMAFENSWLKFRNKPYNFVDIMLRTRGQLVQDIHAAFAIHWTAHTGEVLPIPETSLEHTNHGNIDMMHTVHLISSPTHDTHPVTYFFGLSFLAATKSITIASPYFIPGDVLTSILIKKAKSGISIKLYLQGDSDKPRIRVGTQSYYTELLEAGIQIFEYKGNVLHTKAFVIDDVWTVVGSANINIRSRRINEENILGVQSEKFATKVTAILNSYQKSSKEITLEDWRKRSKLKPLYEFVVRQFSEQF